MSKVNHRRKAAPSGSKRTDRWGRSIGPKPQEPAWSGLAEDKALATRADRHNAKLRAASDDPEPTRRGKMTFNKRGMKRPKIV